MRLSVNLHRVREWRGLVTTSLRFDGWYKYENWERQVV